MKKIIALVLALMMVLCFAGCKSEEQKAADEFIADVEKLLDEAKEAVEDEDVDKLTEIAEEIAEMGEDYEEILEDLEDKDEDAAEEFEEKMEELGEEFEEAMSEVYEY